MEKKKIVNYLFNSYYRFYVNSTKLGFHKKMNDVDYLCKQFRGVFNKDLNLTNPKTFNEKIQWLKIYDRNKEYVSMVDKIDVKNVVANIIGNEFIIPTIGVWDSFDDIDFDLLPNEFVLKCTHDSGSTVVCKDKASFDYKKARKKIEKALKRNYYYLYREWPYKSVKPRIIAEKYMVDELGADEITDYKFYCFNGRADCVMVCMDRKSGDTKFYFFDRQWKLKRINERGKKAPKGFTIEKPVCMDKMFDLAEKLTKGIPFVRLDMYQCGGSIYFGEYTFYPGSGLDPNYLPETEVYFGNLIDINNVTQRKGY